MAVVAIGLALDQAWALTTPGACNGLTGSLIDGEDIEPIDSHTWHIVTCGPVSDITAAHVIGDGSGFGIAIVLGNENHRQFPDAGEIESFMEGTLIGSAVTKETDSNLASAIVLRGQSCSSRKGESTTNNAIGTEHALIHIRDMHRAALATAGS